jgi:hypothetical protein
LISSLSAGRAVMFKNVPFTIDALFAHEQPRRKPVTFTWRLVRRHGRPFLLLPEGGASGSTAMELYSAQRAFAKLCRFLIPFALRSPAASMFQRVTIEADAGSEWMQFLARQSGQKPERLQAPAIMFSGLAENRARLLLLLCDAGGYPIRVVKAGLHPIGRSTTDREADLLSSLPAEMIGCTGITGRFSNETVSAFATAFFPGKSLATDVGIEKLFHAWLSHDELVPIEDLAGWRELDVAAARAEVPQWPIIREALCGKKVRSTLFHGDFAPWNVRMTNLESIRAYDWESGNLKGIPAWDWFHFIVQSSFLLKDHTPERVAAELEQLVRSPRFQDYAGAAGISGLVEPLLLAYLLHKKYVVRPPKGDALITRLFDLIWAHWNWERKSTGQTEFISAWPVAPSAPEQVRAALRNLANLFWEPSLSPEAKPPLKDQIVKHWKWMGASLAWIAGVFGLSFITDPHLLFAPFYLFPCIFLVMKGDRRLASFIAYIAAIMVPLVFYSLRPAFAQFQIVVWNIIMRTVVFQLIVLLLDRVQKQSLDRTPRKPASEPDVVEAISGNWAVILISSLFLVAVVILDTFTDPGLILLPFYLLPCVVTTLAMNWRWGTVVALSAAILGPLLQWPDPGYGSFGIEAWNTFSRFLLFEAVVLLLERVRRQSILFRSGARRTHSESCELCGVNSTSAEVEPASGILTE